MFQNQIYSLIIFILTISLSYSFTNFILVGSTGDLSKKYLWEALFVQYIENNIGDSIMIYAGATRSEIEGLPIIQSSLNSLHCKESWSKEICEKGLLQFKNKVVYVRLKNNDDYKLLNSKLDENNKNNNDNNGEETLRIFYLSVSPSLYQDIATSINSYARPKGELRVVFEKPFGMDLQSAIDLSNQLSLHLKESEIYRVDHYLGKVGMKSIIDFRGSNLNLLSLLNYPSFKPTLNILNHEQVEEQPTCDITSTTDLILNNSSPLIEIVMKEMEDIAGRSVYYDQFGVIRDVMQNHLTQALVYSLMDLSQDLDNLNKETFGRLNDRLHLLKELKYTSAFQNHDTCSISSNNDENNDNDNNNNNKGNLDALWLGQYSDYLNHLEQDLIEYARKSSTIKPTEVSSKTPTAASVIFELNLKNVVNTCQNSESSNNNDPLRILISAGKALDLREMYVRIRSSKDLNCSITFGVQGGLSKHINQLQSDNGPYILLDGNCWIQSNLPQIVIPSEWSILTSSCNAQFYNRINSPVESVDKFNHQTEKVSCILRPKYIFETKSLTSATTISKTIESPTYSNKFRNNAYIEILGALLRNDRSYFTTTEELLSQWKIWDDVLKDSQCENIEPYHIGWNGLD